jgi:hypothetical protein
MNKNVLKKKEKRCRRFAKLKISKRAPRRTLFNPEAFHPIKLIKFCTSVNKLLHKNSRILCVLLFAAK